MNESNLNSPPPLSHQSDAESLQATMRTCPYCLEPIHADAVRCRHCRTWLHNNPLQNEWYRSSEGKIAGICRGLADQFCISASLVRILFVLLTIFGAGTGLIIYVALWFIMPLAPPRLN